MFSTWGALTGLAVAIVLIVRKVTPAYALVLGALVGGLLGGGGLPETGAAMIGGAQSMMPSVLRILTSGILAGALVKTGSAEKIADAIIRALGARFALAAIALATLIVTAVGVFVDIAVITVAPVALAVGRRAGIPVPALLLAMVGGGKAGNVISPNPNTIAAADAFGVDLTALMMKNLVPARLPSRSCSRRCWRKSDFLAANRHRPPMRQMAAPRFPLWGRLWRGLLSWWRFSRSGRCAASRSIRSLRCRRVVWPPSWRAAGGGRRRPTANTGFPRWSECRSCWSGQARWRAS